MNSMITYNPIIDYTLLDLSASNDEISLLCANAVRLKVASVCVRTDKVKIAKRELSQSEVLVCTVISFPTGENSIDDKCEETLEAISNGVDEVDVVINYRNKDNKTLLNNELIQLSNLCKRYKNKLGRPICLKVIVESGLHTIEEVSFFTQLCIDTNVDFIKTSTGMTNVGAEIDKVKKMYEVIQKSNANLKIKASGGIRSIDQILEFLPFVDRFGMGYQSVNNLNA